MTITILAVVIQHHASKYILLMWKSNVCVGGVMRNYPLCRALYVQSSVLKTVYCEYLLIHHKNMVRGLTGYSLVLVHQVLGNCGRLKGLVDEVVAD